MNIGFVVIGRNEGVRLVECLDSIVETGCPIIYVDSGSSDNSVENARSVGADIVELDMSAPFTAARARNAGFEQLVSKYPHLEFVHFIDGDCALVPGWIEVAFDFLSANPNVGVVCGWRQEKYPDASIYNGLCQREWYRPPGETKACGGDAIIRIDALRQVGGYSDNLIAGEEPELCIRLRKLGWKIWRLAHAMTLHDAAMYNFSQWWRRMIRAGFAYASVCCLHFRAPEAIWFKETVRAVFWGIVLPIGIVLLSQINNWLLLGFLLYPLQVVRIALREGWNKSDSWVYGLFMTIGKFAEAYGVVRFFISRTFHLKQELIEYKQDVPR